MTCIERFYGHKHRPQHLSISAVCAPRMNTVQYLWAGFEGRAMVPNDLKDFCVTTLDKLQSVYRLSQHAGSRLRCGDVKDCESLNWWWNVALSEVAVRFATRYEYVTTAEDVLVRRLRPLFLVARKANDMTGATATQVQKSPPRSLAADL
jgi:hypothetical protein